MRPTVELSKADLVRLRGMLASPDPKIRVRAGLELQRSENHAAGMCIVQALTSERIDAVKRSLIASVALMRKPVSGRWLTSIAAVSQDESTIYYALEHLRRCKYAGSLWVAVARLEDDRPAVLFAAAWFAFNAGVRTAHLREILVRLREFFVANPSTADLNRGPGEFFRDSDAKNKVVNEMLARFSEEGHVVDPIPYAD